MEWAHVWTIIGIIGGLTITVFLVLRNDINKSEKRQDDLRKAELDPINRQVFNHIPTDIKELRTEVKTDIKQSEDHIIDRMDALLKAYFNNKK